MGPLSFGIGCAIDTRRCRQGQMPLGAGVEFAPHPPVHRIARRSVRRVFRAGGVLASMPHGAQPLREGALGYTHHPSVIPASSWALPHKPLTKQAQNSSNRGRSIVAIMRLWATVITAREVARVFLSVLINNTVCHPPRQ